jgi:hypothetical protein
MRGQHQSSIGAPTPLRQANRQLIELTEIAFRNDPDKDGLLENLRSAGQLAENAAPAVDKTALARARDGLGKQIGQAILCLQKEDYQIEVAEDLSQALNAWRESLIHSEHQAALYEASRDLRHKALTLAVTRDGRDIESYRQQLKQLLERHQSILDSLPETKEKQLIEYCDQAIEMIAEAAIVEELIEEQRAEGDLQKAELHQEDLEELLDERKELINDLLETAF